jgi:hypothetical protein
MGSSNEDEAPSKYRSRMTAGAVLMGVGLSVTVALYLLAPGSAYVLGWGLVVLGTLLFLLGLGEWLLGRKPTPPAAGKAKRFETDTQIYDFDEAEAQEVRTELRRLGAQLREPNNAYWVLANRKLAEARDASDWDRMKTVYRQLARQLFEGGKEHFEAASAAHMYELRTFEPFGVGHLEISTAGETSCLQCKSLRGRRVSLPEATDSMPLPVRNCSNQVKQKGSFGWCRCTYLAVMD